MSLMVKDMQRLKSYNKIWKKIEKLMKIDLDTETTYSDDDDKYIKTKIKTYKDLQIFIKKMGLKKYQQKKYHTNVSQ